MVDRLVVRDPVLHMLLVRMNWRPSLHLLKGGFLLLRIYCLMIGGILDLFCLFCFNLIQISMAIMLLIGLNLRFMLVSMTCSILGMRLLSVSLEYLLRLITLLLARYYLRFRSNAMGMSFILQSCSLTQNRNWRSLMLRRTCIASSWIHNS